MDAGHVSRQVGPAVQLLQAVAEVAQLSAGKILCGLILRAHQPDDVSIPGRVRARGNGQGNKRWRSGPDRAGQYIAECEGAAGLRGGGEQ